MTQRTTNASSGLRFEIHEFDEVTSTNDIVKQAALDGAPEGFVACARKQTAGYGRRGNSWQSEPGSLYMSLLLRPRESVEFAPSAASAEFATNAESESIRPAPSIDKSNQSVSIGPSIQTLPLVVAIAVRRALASLLPASVAESIMMKWPNDIVVDRRACGDGDTPHLFNKLCGISCELKHGAVCIGIGVNVEAPEPSELSVLSKSGKFIGTDGDAESLSAPNFVEEGQRNRPTYLSELAPAADCPKIEQVRDAVLNSFASVYEEWSLNGFAPFRSECECHMALLGQQVKIEEALVVKVFPQGEVAVATPSTAATMSTCCVPCCIINGIDDEGKLFVSECETGEELEVIAGRVIREH